MLQLIDPGPDTSGVVWFDPERSAVIRALPEMPNVDLLDALYHSHGSLVVCEWFESMGMAVGSDVFRTIRWIGRFEEARLSSDLAFETITRRQVKLALCGNMRAKDDNVRTAILDRFGGAKAAKGTKANPGPLRGISQHSWSALAVGLTWLDMHGEELF